MKTRKNKRNKRNPVKATMARTARAGRAAAPKKAKRRQWQPIGKSVYTKGQMTEYVKQAYSEYGALGRVASAIGMVPATIRLWAKKLNLYGKLKTAGRR